MNNSNLDLKLECIGNINTTQHSIDKISEDIIRFNELLKYLKKSEAIKTIMDRIKQKEIALVNAFSILEVFETEFLNMDKK